MRVVFPIMLAMLAVCGSVHACDVCGCSASNQYLGLLPRADLNFVGFQYQYSSFRSDHPSLFAGKPNEHSNDRYSTYQLWGRYVVRRRLQLFAFVPYRYNVQRQDSLRLINSGIGDVSVLANAVVLRDNDGDHKWEQQLLAGGGVKAPTGTYSGITAMDKQGLPNMQPGTGSWDFIVNTNYTVRKRSFGFNFDAAYSLTTANRESYKYGNRLNAGLLIFYAVKGKKLNFLPQAGLRYEYALHDYDNYSRKWLNEQSGGYMCFATAGLQAYYKKWGVKYSLHLPVAQQYSSGYVTAQLKTDVSIFFLF